MLNHDEVRAHIDIIALVRNITRAKNSSARAAAEWHLYNQSNDLLRKFEPRCPVCSRVVSWTDWSSGLRAAKCSACNHTWKEADIDAD